MDIIKETNISSFWASAWNTAGAPRRDVRVWAPESEAHSPNSTKALSRDGNQSQTLQNRAPPCQEQNLGNSVQRGTATHTRPHSIQWPEEGPRARSWELSSLSGVLHSGLGVGVGMDTAGCAEHPVTRQGHSGQGQGLRGGRMCPTVSSRCWVSKTVRCTALGLGGTP